MTKLNITNKTIYKLKKIKIKINQRKMFLKKENIKKENRRMVGVLEKEEENTILKIILLKNIKNKEVVLVK